MRAIETPPYNGTSMQRFRVASLGLALLACSGQALGQAEYRIYQERPRLFLEAGRLARLQRDVDRQTFRWQSLAQLVEDGKEFPEQPLVDALRFQVEGAEQSGRNAVEWARGLAEGGIRTAADLRMAALVYDWCHPLFDENTGEAARTAIAKALEDVLPGGSIDVGLVRAAILAAIALAGDWNGSEEALAGLLGSHWNVDVRPALESGQLTDDGASLIAVLEASLAVRHNLETDLLRPATEALAALVRTRLLSYYPVDIETSEGLARRPSRFGSDDGQAAIQAPLYRIAELLLVAYESNLREFQFIQGWVRDDHYLLRSPMAAPYEFLWGNPYLPGLTPQSAPTLAHDALRGRLYGRLDWQRPTTWIGYAEGRLELLAGDGAAASDSLEELSPMYFPDAVVVPVQPPTKFVLSWQPPGEPPPEVARIYLIGLRAGDTYGLKVGGRPARLVQAGAGGILVLHSDPNTPKRDRIDLRRKVRFELRPTLKPSDPRRPRPTLGR